MTQELALIIIAAVAGAGLLVLAFSVLSVARAIRKTLQAVDDIRGMVQASREASIYTEKERLEIERKALEQRSRADRPRVLLIKASNLKLFEEKQELTVGYRVLALGPGKVLLSKLQVALINRRSPQLVKVIDMTFNQVVGADQPFEAEAVATAGDFAKISLPFVPDFGFIKEACQLMASAEVEDQFGEKSRIDRDILEW